MFFFILMPRLAGVLVPDPACPTVRMVFLVWYSSPPSVQAGHLGLMNCSSDWKLRASQSVRPWLTVLTCAVSLYWQRCSIAGRYLPISLHCSAVVSITGYNDLPEETVVFFDTQTISRSIVEAHGRIRKEKNSETKRYRAELCLWKAVYSNDLAPD